MAAFACVMSQHVEDSSIIDTYLYDQWFMKQIQSKTFLYYFEKHLASSFMTTWQRLF